MGYRLLEKYKTFIDNIPVDDFSEKIEYSNWENKLSNTIINSILLDIFKDKTTIYLSKRDIRNSLQTESLDHFLLKILLWGYPTLGRGNNIRNLTIEYNWNILKINIKEITDKTDNDFNIVYSKLKSISGLGPSTITKFLYFLDLNFNGNKALILDDKIIEALTKSPYAIESLKKMNRETAQKYYLEYISHFAFMSKKLGVDVEKIELFIFLFYNKLK